MKKYSVNLTIEIPFDEVESLLVSAFEGGSNYWYSDLLPLKRTSKAKTASERFYENCMKHGFSLKEVNNNQKKVVHATDLELALANMALKYPKHFNDLRSGNADASTGDVFLQLATFGEVING